MSSSTPPAQAKPPAVLHVVGRVTEPVFKSLGPATARLADRGISQTIVLVDDPRLRRQLPRFHPAVRLVLSNSRGSVLDTFSRLVDATCEAARTKKPAAVHLHGPFCSLLGLYASRFRGVSAPAYFYSPKHQAPGQAGFAMLAGVVRRLAERMGQQSITALLDRQGGHNGHLPDPASRRPQPHAQTQAPLAGEQGPPHIVGGSHAPRLDGADAFVQCAVLLADQLEGLTFSWIGPADMDLAARFKAANVDLPAHADEAERALCLAAAWLCIAPPSVGTPQFLAEAMALGRPCVAWDTSAHRSLVTHAHSGFLCRDLDEVLRHVVALMESPDMRAQIGDAARHQIMSRLTGDVLRTSLLTAYLQEPGH